MFPSRSFNILVVVALGVMAALTLRLAMATTDVVSGGPAVEANARPAVVDNVRTYRHPLAECFDLPLSEAAACHIAGGTAAESTEHQSRPYRHPLDECFDVPLREAARCDE